VTDDGGSGWDGAAYDQVNGLQRWVADRTLAELVVAGDERALDVGCGDGRITAELARRLPRGSVLGIDPSPGMLEVARGRITADTPHLGFAEGAVETLDLHEEFDLVVSFNALHWVSDHPEAFARMSRALVVGGRAVLQLVCEGERPSVEDVASAVAAGPAYSSRLSGATAPYHHPVEAVFLDEARAAGFTVVDSRVDDLAWDFGTPAGLREWLRVGFSAWLLRLPDDVTRVAFVDDVATSYAAVVDSVTVVRFLQLRVELHRP